MSDPEAALVQKIIYTSFFVPLILSGVLVWFIVFYQRKRNEALLREKDLIIKRQNALELERTRIASEMHDDIGGGLTSIKFLSQKLLRKIDGDQNKLQAQKIVSQAQELVGNMSEIIWAMNAGFDTVQSLIAYVRHYTFDLFEDHEIKVNFMVKGETDDVALTGERRRNIFLVLKEALHNIIKHANCGQVDIQFNISENQLELFIADDGQGMLKELSEVGNGLGNMRKRIGSMNGVFNFEQANGFSIRCTIPL